MGNSVAKAKENAADEVKTVNGILQTLQNKLDAFLLEVEAKRGMEANVKEVAGGRSVLRVSEVRVSDGSGADENITAGVSNFFDAATNAVEGGDDESSQTSAIDGAKNLITAGLSALFGVSNGQGQSKRSFMVLFLNNAFVRVDYFAYSYSVSAKVWGAEANQSGFCYLCDLSVLNTTELFPNEIDYLLSQALSINTNELNELNKLKFALIQSAVVSRVLIQKDLDFTQLQEISGQLASTQEAIASAFNRIEEKIALRVAEEKRKPEQDKITDCVEENEENKENEENEDYQENE